MHCSKVTIIIWDKQCEAEKGEIHPWLPAFTKGGKSKKRTTTTTGLVG